MDSKIEKARLGAQGDASSWVWNGVVNTLADLASIGSDTFRLGKGIGCALFNDQASGYDRARAVANDALRGLTLPGVGIAARAAFRAAKGIGKAAARASRGTFIRGSFNPKIDEIVNQKVSKWIEKEYE